MTRGFLRNDSGAMGLWLLFWTVLFLALGGIAIDGSNGYRNRTMLQVTADTASHAAAAVIAREGTEAEALQAAYDTAATNLSFEGPVNPVEVQDIEFGIWDTDSQSFIVDGDGPTRVGVYAAVRVTARMQEDRDTALPTYLLRVIGFDSFDIQAQSIAAIAIPPCVNNGIISFGWVNLTSNVDFGELMCIHGQQGVSARNNLIFGDGSVVSTTDIRHVNEGGQLNVPTSNFAHVQAHAKPGSMKPLMAREEVLRARFIELRDKIALYPDYKRVTHGGSSTSAWNFVADYQAGYRKFYLTCNNSQNKFDFGNVTFLIENVIIVTTCSLKNAGSIAMKDIIIAVDNPALDSIFLNGNTNIASSALDCSMAGNFVAISTGGIKFTSQQSYANTELLATKTISYTAGGETHFNVSIQSWGNVDMTAGGKFENCPSENPYSLGFEAAPRLVGS